VKRAADAPVTPLPQQRSASRRVFRLVRERFREGRAQIGEANWRAWWRTVLIGAAGLVVLMIILVKFAQQLVARGTLAREPDFLMWLGANGPFSFSTAVFFQAFGTDITLVILIILTAGIAAWARRPLTALSLIVGYVVLDLVVRFGWGIWDRSRPKVLMEGLVAPSFHSFPSGHTGKTVVIYGFLTYLWWRASRSTLERILAVLLLFFISVVVPIGRLSMGVHWPSDIVAGFTIGLVYLCVLLYALRYERRA
jgi:undecaprenyl-diphosphatase